MARRAGAGRGYHGTGAMRIRDTAKPKADGRPRMRHMLKSQMVSRHWTLPYRLNPAYPSCLNRMSRGVYAVVTGFACGCGTCRRLAGLVFVILVSVDRCTIIRRCKKVQCRATLCVCALVHTAPSQPTPSNPRDQRSATHTGPLPASYTYIQNVLYFIERFG